MEYWVLSVAIPLVARITKTLYMTIFIDKRHIFHFKQKPRPSCPSDSDDSSAPNKPIYRSLMQGPSNIPL